jgi:hypothetical protein
VATREPLSWGQMHTMSDVFARRLGRIAFGGVLIAGVAVLATGAWAGLPHGLGRDWPSGARIVGWTWLAAAIAGVVARLVAARVRWARDPEALFAESVMLPTAGFALMLPITLHLPVVLAISDSRGFDLWVEASLWITGVAHLAFAGMCAQRARRLVAGKPALPPRTIYLVTVITSCVPFVVLWAIPPLLVAITAAPFVPMLRYQQRLVARELAELAAVTHDLPRAIARHV